MTEASNRLGWPVTGCGGGFGLFRIISILTKLKQKELALNSTEILQLN